MSSFIMSGDRHKNTAQSCEPVSLQSVEQRAEVLQIRFMYMLSRRWHRPPPALLLGKLCPLMFLLFHPCTRLQEGQTSGPCGANQELQVPPKCRTGVAGWLMEQESNTRVWSAAEETRHADQRRQTGERKAIVSLAAPAKRNRSSNQSAELEILTRN